MRDAPAPPGSRDFWRASGFHLLRRDAAGHLAITDDFLRAYLARPELRPVPESCAAEIALHEALLAEPRLAVDAARLEALADADVRDNYRAVLRFRDRLLAAGTLEGAYLVLFRGGAIDIPPLFVDHLAHAILRNLLDGCDDPLRVRAAELLFRSQTATLAEGAVMLADEETVAMHAETGGFGELGRLLAATATPMRSVSLDVLGAGNAELYWARSDRFDTVLDLTFGRVGLDALCRVLEAWVAHFLGIVVAIEPVQAIRDERWAWHVGLDAESSAILNDLYRGAAVGDERLGRLVSLFRLTVADAAAMLPAVAGRPVYLGLAVDAGRRLRLKPQNLLVNLPLAWSA
jgi:plasmid stability protein